MGPVVIDTSANSKRMIAFLIVVVVHVLLVYGFNAGIGSVMVEKVFGPMETEIIEEVKEEEDKPPPPPPKLETPPPFVPPPDIAIEIAPVESTTAIQVTTTTRPVEAPPPAQVRQAVVVGPGYSRNAERDNPKPEYPMSEQRAEHECTVVLDVQVLETGRIGEIKLKQPCEFPKLNESALQTVKRWRMRPGTIDGKPTSLNVQIPVVFKKEDK